MLWKRSSWISEAAVVSDSESHHGALHEIVEEAASVVGALKKRSRFVGCWVVQTLAGPFRPDIELYGRDDEEVAAPKLAEICGDPLCRK